MTVPPGVGKTHLAVGLGLKAIAHGYRVLFTTAAVLIAALTRALAEGRLDDKLKVYTMPRLLIVDEIGYLPIDRQGANLFFQLISRRYERGPMFLTSNQSFGSWGEVFGDRVIATAILDRILHHAITLNIRGNSYRLKDKLKAGLVRPAEPRSEPRGGEFSLLTSGGIWVPVDAPARPAPRLPPSCVICSRAICHFGRNSIVSGTPAARRRRRSCAHASGGYSR